MADSKISALTNLAALAGTENFAVADGTAVSKKVLASVIAAYVLAPSQSSGAPQNAAVICQQATYTLTSSTSQQKLFNGGASGNGSLTITTGAYLFEGLVAISSMSATSGNGAFDILGAGTATLNLVQYAGFGLDNTTPTTAAAISGSLAQTHNSTDPIVTAATGTGLMLRLSGMFNCNSGGTIIPSFALHTAAAAIVAAGSFLRVWPFGANGATYAGNWS